MSTYKRGNLLPDMKRKNKGIIIYVYYIIPKYQ